MSILVDTISRSTCLHRMINYREIVMSHSSLHIFIEILLKNIGIVITKPFLQIIPGLPTSYADRRHDLFSAHVAFPSLICVGAYF